MIKNILIFFLVSFSGFALKIDNLDFNKKVKIGEQVKAMYTLENSKEFPLKYKLKIEGDLKNIVVTPKILVIPSFSKRTFNIQVTGIKKGEQKYFLVLEEERLNLQDEGANAKIKMKYRIEQKYFGE